MSLIFSEVTLVLNARKLKTMKLYDLHGIVHKIVGNITATGEHSVDTKRLDNLKELCELTESLIDEIKEVSDDNHNSHEDSVKEITKCAYNFIQDMKQI